MQVEVLAEEVVGTFEGANNGAGPMWCYASPTIVREGDWVFASLWEVGRDVKPLCNTRWQLFRRERRVGWERVQVSPRFDEREPCPILRLPGGRVLLSVNPARSPLYETEDGRCGYVCEPQFLEFDAADPQRAPRVLRPKWDRDYEFTEHSYRGCAADHRTGEVLLLNQTLDEEVSKHRSLPVHSLAWSYRDAGGEWSRRGLLRFPVRGCYPHVALRNSAAYVMAVSDIIEPNPEWRAYKKKVTGRHWDYEFRQLFFTWSPDIKTEEFSPILTFASRDETAGMLRNRDMWIGPDGEAHVIYTDRNVWHPFMRDKYFPDLPITVALKYCRIREGAVVERRVLAERVEDVGGRSKDESPSDPLAFPGKGPLVTDAALHATPDARLFVLYHAEGGDDEQGPGACYLAQLWPKVDEPPLSLPLRYPLHAFFTASERMGTEPSHIIDAYGMGPEPDTMRYAQVAIR